MKQPTVIIHHDHVRNKFSIEIDESFDTSQEAESYLKRMQDCKIKWTQSLWD